MGSSRFRDILLIHGAWQGSWAWSELIPYLKAKDYRCYSADMPGNGHNETKPHEVSMEIYMAYLRGLLEGIGKPVVVIGHSSGGIISSQLAELNPKKVKGILYLTAMMLPSGMRFAELVAEFSKKDEAMLGIIPYLEWSKDGETSQVSRCGAHKIFYQDCSKKVAEAAFTRLTPHPKRGRDIYAKLTKKNFGSIPRAYIEATEDQSILHEMQRRMQHLVPGARRYAIKSGHAPHLSMPKELAEIIAQAINNLNQV